MIISDDVIEEVKTRLVKAYDPLTIYLFGSYAWGQPTEKSDLDILVVVEHSDENSPKRTMPGYLALWGLDISKDLLVYTREEFESRLANKDAISHSFLSKIANEGKVLYARA